MKGFCNCEDAIIIQNNNPDEIRKLKSFLNYYLTGCRYCNEAWLCHHAGFNRGCLVL